MLLLPTWTVQAQTAREGISANRCLPGDNDNCDASYPMPGTGQAVSLQRYGPDMDMRHGSLPSLKRSGKPLSWKTR